MEQIDQVVPANGYRGKTQFQVRRESLEEAARICEWVAANSKGMDGERCAELIRRRIPSVVKS